MSYYLINGEPADLLPVTDRGLHYGDGVFETIKVTGTTLQHWHDHMSRLLTGCERLKLPKPGIALLEREAQLLIAAAMDSDTKNLDTQKNRILKIIITRGSGQRGYRLPEPCEPTRVMALYTYPDYPPECWSNGVRLTICETPLACNPRLAGIKHLNRLEQVLARSEWDDPDVTDGVMLDTQQRVIETTMCNIFWVTGHEIITPDVTDCGVAGVMRNFVIQQAKQLQLSVKIGQYFTEDLFAADEIFITNSVHGIWPVQQLDHYKLKAGSVTRQLMDVVG